MKYLFDNYKKIERELKNKNIFIFLDYDGTLTPIVKKPEDAIIGIEAKRLIERLKRKYKGRLAVISGRPLTEIKKLVGIKGIIYAGNHGLEIEKEKKRFNAALPADYKTALKKIKKRLIKELDFINGAFMEDKSLTISVHYRLIKDGQSTIKKIIDRVLKPYIAGKKIKVNNGKKVIEIKPPVNWDKGSAVLWILKGKTAGKVIPVYIGDDITDEDAFTALKGHGLTVHVGKTNKSEAEYYLKNSGEVITFLKKILKIKEVRHALKNSKRTV